MRAAAVLLGLLVVACGDEGTLGPGRSVRLQFEVAGLPDGAAAEYRVFVQDTVPIAHGTVASGETDTVRISSSARLSARWQDALVPVGEAAYIFAPGEREVVIDESDTDTSVALAGSFALASGGFILTTSGMPEQGARPWGAPLWQVRSEDDSVLAYGFLGAGDVVRRGDLPPGPARLELDTVLVELDGLNHAYAPAQREIPLSLSVSLDLLAIHVPYALASTAVRLGASGLPAGTLAPWGMHSLAGNYSVGGSVPTDTVRTIDYVPPGSYTLEWGEVTVNGITYLPTPATQLATLEPSLVPYEFATLYAAAP